MPGIDTLNLTLKLLDGSGRAVRDSGQDLIGRPVVFTRVCERGVECTDVNALVPTVAHVYASQTADVIATAATRQVDCMLSHACFEQPQRVDIFVNL